MGVKKRNRINAQFNMSSMTDIIFLLLIFFMLTSNLVAPNAVLIKLPGKGNPSVDSSDPPDVGIRRDGSFTLDGKKISGANLEAALRRLVRKQKGKRLDITVSPNDNAPLESTVFVIDIAKSLKINPIWALNE